MLTLKCEYETQNRSFKQQVVLDSGDCGSGFAKLFCEYCRLSGTNPSKADENELSNLMTGLLLG